jgi:hypothetical protein
MNPILIRLYLSGHFALQAPIRVLAATGRQLAWLCLACRAAAFEPPS